MSFEEFREAINRDAAQPAGLSRPLEALWHDARGDWNRAHDCAQRAPGRNGARVHAYLPRRDGAAANAGYWYARAGRPPASSGFAAEWEAIARELLGRGATTDSCG